LSEHFKSPEKYAYRHQAGKNHEGRENRVLTQREGTKKKEKRMETDHALQRTWCDVRGNKIPKLGGSPQARKIETRFIDGHVHASDCSLSLTISTCFVSQLQQPSFPSACVLSPFPRKALPFHSLPFPRN